MDTIEKKYWPEFVEESDIGKIVLWHPGGGTCAVEETLEKCVAVWNNCSGENITCADVCTDDDYHGGLRSAEVVL